MAQASYAEQLEIRAKAQKSFDEFERYGGISLDLLEEDLNPQDNTEVKEGEHGIT